MLIARWVLVAGIFAVAPVSAGDPPAQIWVHGVIYTGVRDSAAAAALVIRGDRIEYVGDEATARARAPANAKTVDLRGATVIPGFVDAHQHLAGVGFRELDFNLEGTTGVADLRRRVRERMRTVKDGDWLSGGGWIETHWQPAQFPTRQALDDLTPHTPASLERADGHAILVNSEALRRAHIDRQTPDPVGGHIVRDAQGEATGILVDNATLLVDALVPQPADAQLREALEVGAKRSARLGWTGVDIPGNSRREVAQICALIEAHRMPLHVYDALNAPGPEADELLRSGPQAECHGQLPVRGLKFYIDGALGSRGAALLAPYSDAPELTGLLIHTKDELVPLFERAARSGIQVWTHAIGDRGNRLVLDAYEEALTAVPEKDRAVKEPRWRVEHAQILNPTDIPRFAQLGVIASMQPSHAISDMYFAPARLGADRLAGAYAWRSLLDAHAVVAAGTDAPVEKGDPLVEFYAAVYRHSIDGFAGPDWHLEQRVTRPEALRMLTWAPAYAAFDEDNRGTIEAGQRADLILLRHRDERLLAWELGGNPVDLVICAGRRVV